MARGNQRDLAREKNQRKLQEQEKRKGSNNKAGNQGMSYEQRKQRDAEVMRNKQLQALERQQSSKASASS